MKNTILKILGYVIFGIIIIYLFLFLRGFFSDSFLRGYFTKTPIIVFMIIFCFTPLTYVILEFLKEINNKSDLVAKGNDSNGNVIILENPPKRNRIFKSIVLLSIPCVVMWIYFVITITSGKGAGAGFIAIFLIAPIFLVVTLFYPIYFIILSFRYLREKGTMDILDKVTFYILLMPIVYIIYEIFS